MVVRFLSVLLLGALALSAQTATESIRIYREKYAPRLRPLVCEAVRFPTEPGNQAAVAQQARWLREKSSELKLFYRDAGPVTEIELPGPAGAPVLGLVVHGDVQPAGAAEWSVPPFACTMREGFIYGRGVADDKGPLVQALLAMAALRDSRRPLTHTIRLMVGSDEESDNRDIATYLAANAAPQLSLVLDSEFPVVVGEKAWDALEVTAADAFRLRGTSKAEWSIVGAEAGIAASIVPPRATVRLHWLVEARTGVETAMGRLCPAVPPAGYQCEARQESGEVVLTVTGKAAHSGVNIEGGRNALVMLAGLLAGKVADSGASDLMQFAAMAGKDLYGSGLGLARTDLLWGHYNVNVATLKPGQGGALVLTTNLRRIPPRTHEQIESYLADVVADFNRVHASSLRPGGYFRDEVLSFDPESKIVKRLLAIYARATGHSAPPAISGGGTYAKRLPNAIAFGMWFPGKPYPGHDVDERIAVEDLDRGIAVLLEALNDLACSPPIQDPFRN